MSCRRRVLFLTCSGLKCHYKQTFKLRKKNYFFMVCHICLEEKNSYNRLDRLDLCDDCFNRVNKELEKNGSPKVS